MSIKVSIVTAYYNRKKLFLNTLKSIESSSKKDQIEIIVVDDGSSDDERLEDIVDNYSFPINLIRIEPKDKKHLNSCIPFNKGFNEAKGDIIMIQNPECYHYGDVVKASIDLNKNEYFVFHCYSLNFNETKMLDYNDIGNIILQNRSANFNGDSGYYCHQQFNPRPFHFCSVINKNDLMELRGFDERYAYGMDYEDNEIVERIKRKKIKIKFIESPKVLHQWHYNEKSKVTSSISNRDLFFNFTLRESDWKLS
jgi:GT2 family glycosyltransferase